MNAFNERQTAFRDAFPTLPTPTFKYGLDIQSTLETLPLDSAQKTGAQTPYTHTSEGILISDLQSAFNTHSTLLDQHLASLFSTQNKLDAFHVSHIQNGFFIHIPENTQAQQPILIPPLSSPHSHILIYAGKNSSVHILHSEKSAAENALYSSGVEIIAEENARVEYASMQDFPTSTTRLAFKRAHVKKNASVNWHWAEFGAAFTKMDVTSYLRGENASSQNLGVYVEKDSQSMDLDARAYHEFPQTHSHLLARGVLDDASKNVYNGLVNMRKEAKGSVGNQRVDVLVLSPQAEADPVPALEIEGSDVRCSHAATVGRLDKEKLFYLSSRGLNESEARSLYIRGFLEHVLTQFPHELFHTDCQQIIDARLHLQSTPISPQTEEVLA